MMMAIVSSLLQPKTGPVTLLRPSNPAPDQATMAMNALRRAIQPRIVEPARPGKRSS